MHNVLLVYKQLSLQFDDSGKLLLFDDEQVTHILSFDEKPGIQATAATSEALPPDDNHGCISRGLPPCCYNEKIFYDKGQL